NKPPIQHQLTWRREFHKETQHHGPRASDGLTTTDFLYCGGSLGINLLDTSSVRVEIVGTLQKTGGKTIPFRETFQLDLTLHKKVQIMPYWILAYIERNYKT